MGKNLFSIDLISCPLFLSRQTKSKLEIIQLLSFCPVECVSRFLLADVAIINHVLISIITPTRQILS